jgi:hypothetical protein
MGNEESTMRNDYDKYAYRVLTVLPGSPAEVAGIEAQIDFIKYNPLSNGKVLFSEYIASHVGKEMRLSVYNLI